MTETFRVSIGKKELYSREYNQVKRFKLENNFRFNISRSLVDILSIIMKEEK